MRVPLLKYRLCKEYLSFLNEKAWESQQSIGSFTEAWILYTRFLLSKLA